MSLGNPADHIEVEGHFLLEVDERGWWHSYCICGVATTSDERPVIDGWMERHSSHCKSPKRAHSG